MKDNRQNTNDLMAVIAEDIEVIKEKLNGIGTLETDGQLSLLMERLEPLLRWGEDDTFATVNGIFGSSDRVSAYQQETAKVLIRELQKNFKNNQEENRKKGVLPIDEMFDKIYGKLSELASLEQHTEKGRSKTIPSAMFQRILPQVKSKWGQFRKKIPQCLNPYFITKLTVTLLFVFLFGCSWYRWHEYRRENARLQIIADKYRVSMAIVNEVHPQTALTIGAYDKLVETVGADSTLVVFWEQVSMVKENREKKSGR